MNYLRIHPFDSTSSTHCWHTVECQSPSSWTRTNKCSWKERWSNQSKLHFHLQPHYIKSHYTYRFNIRFIYLDSTAPKKTNTITKFSSNAFLWLSIATFHKNALDHRIKQFYLSSFEPLSQYILFLDRSGFLIHFDCFFCKEMGNNYFIFC